MLYVCVKLGEWVGDAGERVINIPYDVSRSGKFLLYIGKPGRIKDDDSVFPCTSSVFASVFLH